MKTLGLSILLLLGACGDQSAGPDGSMPDGADGPVKQKQRAIIVSTDYVNPGTATVIEMADGNVVNTTDQAIAGVGSDPALRRQGGDLYLINRGVDSNIVVINVDTLEPLEQFSTAPAAVNPQDVALANGRLYVVSLDGTGVAYWNRSDLAAGPQGSIDLSQLDPDGVPDCTSIYSVNGKLAVTCGILDRQNFWQARGPGVVAVIDPGTNSLERTFELRHGNPLGYLQQGISAELGAHLYIPTTDFADGGCIEKINTNPGLSSAGCLLQNVDLGGYPTHAYDVGTEVWINVTTGFTQQGGVISEIKAFELATSTLKTMAVTKQATTPGVFARCPDQTIVVTDTASSSARFFTLSGEDESKNAVDFVLTPTSIVCY